MTTTAKKIAAYCADVVARTGGAISTSASFDDVKRIPGMDKPLRRPSRCCPSKEIEQLHADSEAARQALQDTEGMISYEEFRKEIGLGE